MSACPVSSESANLQTQDRLPRGGACAPAGSCVCEEGLPVIARRGGRAGGGRREALSRGARGAAGRIPKLWRSSPALWHGRRPPWTRSRRRRRGDFRSTRSPRRPCHTRSSSSSRSSRWYALCGCTKKLLRVSWCACSPAAGARAQGQLGRTRGGTQEGRRAAGAVSGRARALPQGKPRGTRKKMHTRSRAAQPAPPPPSHPLSSSHALRDSTR